MKRLLAIGVILLFLGMTISSTGFNLEKQSIKSMSFGNILYVGGNGTGNYSKIQDAINDASDGDTVYVYDDSSPYYENIVVEKTINLTGENKETTVIDGRRENDVILISSHNVKISGFTLKNSGKLGWQNDHDAGIDIRSSYSIISDNILLNNYHGIASIASSNNTYFNNTIYQNSAYGIVLWDYGNNNISCNTISNNKDGILVSYEKYNKILNNVFVSNENYGLAVTRNHNTISGNTFYNDGLFIDASTNNISNNTVNGKPLIYLEKETDKIVEEPAGQIILVKCNNITIQNQEINNTYNGIQLYRTNNSLISNCILSDNSNLGLDLESSDNNIFSNNVLASNGWLGAVVFLSNNNTFLGNTISQNKVYGLWLIGSSDWNSILNNNIEKNLQGGIRLSEFNNGDEDIYPNNIIISSNLIKSNDGGIGSIYGGVRDITITNNTITKNRMGINLANTRNIIIRGNTINKNIQGIALSDSRNNTIISNIFSRNIIGINLGSSSTIITHNNFIRNLKQASFGYIYGWNYSNSWDGNYWNRPRILPKPIFGWLYYMPPSKQLMVEYDMNPASEPYDIEV